jgi:fibronectin type 3 domain-containing protein
MNFKIKRIILIKFSLLFFLLTFPLFSKAQESITLNPPATGCLGSSGYVNLSWTTISGSPTYFVLRRAGGETTTSTIASTTDNFYLDQTIVSDKNYFYQIKAVRGSDVFYSNTVQTLATYCPPVLSLQTSCKADGPYVDLSWTSVSGNLAFYEIYRDTTKIATTTNTSFSDGPNLEAAKSFNYSVKAIWQDGNSTTSNSLSATIPACPPALSASIGCLGDAPGGPTISLSWNSLFGVQKYQIYRKAQNESDFSLLSETTNTNYTDNLVESLTTYGQGGSISYFVKAIWQSTQSNSLSIEGQIPRCPPFLTVQTNCDEFSYRLSWTATRDASAYNIYKNGSYYIQVTQTYFTDSICEEKICTTTYQVIALAPGQMLSSNSVEKFVDCLTVIPPSPAPVLNPPQAYCVGNDSRISLSWTPSENVRYYVTYRNGESIPDSNVYDTFIEDSGVESGYTYTYFVIAYGKGGTSTTSENSVTITAIDCTPPLAPALSLTRGCSSGYPYVTLSWTDAGNVVSYDVYRGSSYNNLSLITTFLKGSSEFNNRTWTDNNVSTSITYYYQIVANGPPGVPSASSSVVSITTLSCLPTTPSLYWIKNECVNGSPKVTIYWSTDGANTDHFEIFRTGWANPVPLSASARSYPDSSVAPLTNYQYRVDAIGFLGQRASSGSSSVTTYDCTPPGNFTLNDPNVFCQDSYPRATLSWTTSTNSTSYDLYRYLINPDGSIGATTIFYSVTSPYTDFGLGNALNFDGSNDYVLVPNSSSLQITGDLTISFWAYPTNISKGRQNPLGKAYGGEFDLTMETSGQLSYYHGSAGGNSSPYMNCYAYNIFSNNALVHVTIVRNVANKTVTIYKNGIAQTTYCSGWVNPSASDRNLMIGYEYAGYWQGRIDDVRIYARALSSSEVSNLYNGINITDGLRGWWHFDEGSGQVVSDSSNYLNNGRLGSTSGSDTNDPAWVENGLQSNKSYKWQVRANGPGGSTFSNTTTLTTLPLCPPSKPGLRLTASCETTTSLPAVTLRWSFSTNANFYEIYRQDKGLIATTSQNLDPEQRKFTDNNEGAGLSENTSYTYWVRAVNSTGSIESDHLTIITPVCALPTTPQNVNSSFECSGSLPRIKITWSDSDYADYYRIYRDDGWISDKISDTNASTYTFYDSAVRTNTTYIYRIKAFGPGGQSPFSDPTTTTTGFCPPSTPSIKFLTTNCENQNPFNKIYWSDPDVELTQKFYDGFDSGDFSSWSGTNITSGYGEINIDSTNSYQGNYSAKAKIQYLANWTNAYAYKKFGTRYELVYARAYIFINDFSSNTYLDAFLTPTGWGRTVARIGLDSSRHLRLSYFHNGNYYSTTSATVLNLDTWYSVEIKVKVDSDSTGDGEIRVYLNGSEINDLTLTNLIHDGYSTIDGIAVGFIDGYRTSGTIFVDSVIFATNYIGPGTPIYNANQYKIYRNTSGSNPTESDLIKTINASDIEFLYRVWKDTNVNHQTTYYYWLKSIGPAGESSLSSPLSIKTYFCGTPSTPTLNLESVFCEDNLPYAKLSWNPVSNAYSYNLYRLNPDNSLSTYSARLSPFTDRGSSALKFDGYDDYLQIPYSANLQPDTISIEFWIKLTSDPNVDGNNNWRWLISPSGWQAPAFLILEEDRNINFTVYVGGTEYRYIGGVFKGEQLTIGQWAHLVYVYDSITGKGYAYKDGQLSRSGEMFAGGGALTKSTYGWRISHPANTSYPNGNGALPAIVDEVRIYGRALSPTEVQEHYQGIYKNETELRGAWHFDEGRGVTIFDNSGNGNNGIIAGPSWVNSKEGLGKALEFGGMNGYVSLPNSSSLDITNPPLSIFAWIKVKEGADTGWIVAKNYSSASNIQYGMFWRTGDNKIEVYLQGGSRVSSPSNSVLAGNWYFVGFTWDGQYVRLFINGVQSATGTYTGTLSSQPYLRIGRRETSAYPFKGIIDEVRIYNRALTSAEILNLFQGNEVSSSGLVGLWHFEEGSGNTVYDSSPYKNDGTLVKGADWVSPSDAPSQVYVLPLGREKNYKFYLKSAGAGIESSASNEISITTPSCLPAKPNLTVSQHCDGTNPQLILSWSADPNTDYWSIYKKRSTDPTFTFLLNTTLTSYTDGNVESGVDYDYYITAYGKGVSTSSDVITQTAPYCQAPPYNGVQFSITVTSTCYGYDTRMIIEWPSDASGNTLSYNIWRRNVTQGEDFSVVASGIGSSATQFIDSIDQAYEGNDFQYKVEAVGSGPGNSTFSETSTVVTALSCHTATPGFSLLTLVGIQSTADLRIVWLQWTDAGNEEYYEIWRSGSDWEMIATTSGESDPTAIKGWNDSSADRILEDGKTYYYKVIPVNINGAGPESNTEEADIPIAVPGAFTLTGQKTDNEIHLTWTLAATTTKGGPATYKVLRSATKDFTVSTVICDNILETQPLECIDSNPTTLERFYVVVATNLGGSTYSNSWESSLPLPKWKEIAPY